MVLDKDTAKKTAELLLQINAIKLNTENPFTWASGLKAPIYCDNRIILSFPPIRNYIREHMVKQLENAFGKPDVIAGVATGAIGIGILVAEQLGLPFVYVRPEPKKHGKRNQVEGFLDKGKKVVVIEDLISTGRSSLNAAQALIDEDMVIKGMMAVFSYDLPIANKNFKDAGIELYTLSDYNVLLEQAIASSYISNAELEILKTWRTNPSEWKPLQQ